MSNEEKTNDYENFEKEMIYMKILKKGGGSREKGGGGNEIHAPMRLWKIGLVFIISNKKKQTNSTGYVFQVGYLTPLTLPCIFHREWR